MIDLKLLNNVTQEGFDSVYEFTKDDIPIGIGAISKTQENQIYIFIKNELRGMGYGKILFSKMLEEVKKLGYTEVKFEFFKKNTKILKTVVDNGGIHLSTNGNVVKYMLQIAN